MQATKFIIALAAASSPAMGLVLPQACIEVVPAGILPSGVSIIGAVPTGTGVVGAPAPTDSSIGAYSAQAVTEEPPAEEEPVAVKPAQGSEGSSTASSIGSSIGSSILDAGISSVIGYLPEIAGDLFGSGGSSSNSNPQSNVDLQACISRTQACCNNVQGKSDDNSACSDNAVIAAFATNSACAADGDDPVAHATTACKTVLGM